MKTNASCNSRGLKPPIRSGDRLGRIDRRAAAYRTHLRLADLRAMARSRSADRRLLALFLIQKGIASGRKLRRYFEVAESMIDDTDNDCRWQAMIVIGEFIESDPESVWDVVKQYGRHEDGDMRLAVATVLLEHLLEHFPNRFARRMAALRKRSKHFDDTCRHSWDFPFVGGSG